jgi:2-polyprenyl-3-methyl-5-hydroxy-6-metoxy-1,4-benzoquinol methylase
LQHKPASQSYIIRGGMEGRERLRLIARIMRPTTLALFERAGVREGATCLDAGCGGGDVSVELARLVGARGRVVGVDLDAVKLEAARAEAAAAGLGNVEFRQGDILAQAAPPTGFDAVYVRFLLTHLRDPATAVERLRDLLGPGGLLIVEDIDYSGHFIHPPSPAFAAYVDLYRRTALARGAHPDIGPRLPGLLEAAGLTPAELQVVQPAAVRGEVKLANAITMEAIAESVLAAGLATRAEIDRVVGELYRLAGDETTVMSVPRIVQAWGRRAA